jgi:hypothetical protein
MWPRLSFAEFQARPLPTIAQLQAMTARLKERNRRMLRLRMVMSAVLGIWFIVVGCVWLDAVWTVTDAIERRAEVTDPEP